LPELTANMMNHAVVEGRMQDRVEQAPESEM
jgi:hypothetical protein